MEVDCLLVAVSKTRDGRKHSLAMLGDHDIDASIHIRYNTKELRVQ